MDLDNRAFEPYSVVSFDVFDTILFRQVHSPEHVFYFIGQKARQYTGITPTIFIYLRILSEKTCRLYNRLFFSREEVTLAEIYRILGRVSCLSPDSIARLYAEELQQEKILIYENPETVGLIKELAGQGKPCVFTSDMYLPFNFVYDLLQDIGAARSHRQLYLSSAVGVQKRSGNLFRFVLEKEGIRADQLIHMGDNFAHDCSVSSALGIRAVHYKANLPKVPWLKNVGLTDVTRGILKRASDKAFLASAKSGEAGQIELAAAYTAGPVLFSFVYWTLQRAVAEGIERLYFLARDGQILFRIAQLICAELSLPLDLRYLYSSRHSWVLPSILDFDKLSEMSMFFRLSKQLTLRKLLRRFKFEQADAAWLAENIQAAGLELDEPINLLKLDKVKALFAEPCVLAMVEKISAQEAISFNGYLEQEGLFDDVAYALVDTGWRGSLPDALRRFFLKCGYDKTPFMAFFFDLFGTPEYAEIDHCRSFLKETGNEYRAAVRGEMEIVMELFTAATHGSVYGFERVGGRYQPVFMSKESDSLPALDLEKQQQIILDFGRVLLGKSCFVDITPEQIYKESTRNLFSLLNHPSRELAETLAGFPYSCEQSPHSNDGYDTICAPFQLNDFWHLLRNVNVMRSNDLWVQGSLSLTDSLVVRTSFSLFYKILSSAPLRSLEAVIRRAKGL